MNLAEPIIDQLEQLGCSCDWERERFTMDEGLSKAVRTAFVQLYNDGLIYRGEYMVNWCPNCQTAVSDLEVEPVEIDGNFYHIKYPIKGSEESVEIATTRPETMLGDTAVAVHPEDNALINTSSAKQRSYRFWDVNFQSARMNMSIWNLARGH